MFPSLSAAKESRANPESPIRVALTLTAHTIDRRAWWYRNLVVGVVALPLVCGLTALAGWFWYPLRGLLFLVPMCSLFFWLDGRLVRRWQRGVLALWVQGDLDPGVFTQAVSANRHLPKRTLCGLLAVLPDESSISMGRPMQSATRREVSRTCDVIQQCLLDRTAGLTLAAACIAGSIVLWPVLGQTSALGILAGGLLLMPAAYRVPPVRLRALRKQVIGQAENPTFELKRYVDAVDLLDWGAVPVRRKIAFFRTLEASQ